MARTIQLHVKHDLGAALAKQRVADRFGILKTAYIDKIGSAAMTWADDVALVEATALGQKAKATVAVGDAEITLRIELPWLLAGMAGTIESVLKGNADALHGQPEAA